ncbi:MAG: helix-turn-helix domain-containing protein [Pontiellaceae bacterium]|nr:helix-turn-helix domain-containing protein [Pontiellaceae bacterium]
MEKFLKIREQQTMQGNLNIGTIGQKLEAARQSKGVTISEAGQATKIMSKYIEAMEADDFGELAAPVYVKGFIRMYAQYLGLDAVPLVNEYLSQYAPRNKKPQLADDVRQTLVKSDYTPGESDIVLKGRAGLAEAASKMLGQSLDGGLPVKKIVMGVAAVVVLVTAAVGVKQCGRDDNTEPAPVGGAARDHQMISEDVPAVYYSAPGVSD